MIADGFFKFGNVDTRDYGIVVSGQHVFNKPKRKYEFADINGIDGDIVTNGNKLSNVDIMYECSIVSDTESNIEKFSNDLLNRLDAYCELRDSYDAGWYREACITDMIEFNMTQLNKETTFTVTFNCKPLKLADDWYSEVYLVNNKNSSYAGTYSTNSGYKKYVKSSTDTAKIEIDAKGYFSPFYEIRVLSQRTNQQDVTWIKFNDGKQINLKNIGTSYLESTDYLFVFTSFNGAYGRYDMTSRNFAKNLSGFSGFVSTYIDWQTTLPIAPEIIIPDTRKITIETNGAIEIKLRWAKV